VSAVGFGGTCRLKSRARKPTTAELKASAIHEKLTEKSATSTHCSTVVRLTDTTCTISHTP